MLNRDIITALINLFYELRNKIPDKKIYLFLPILFHHSYFLRDNPNLCKAVISIFRDNFKDKELL